MVQTEACESEEAGEGLCGQVVEGVVTELQPLDVQQALEGHVGDVHEPVVCKGEQVEGAYLREGPRLDLLHAIVVDQELLQG